MPEGGIEVAGNLCSPKQLILYLEILNLELLDIYQA